LRVVVFGSGLMGHTVARDLVKSKSVDEVTVCDVDRNRLQYLTRVERSSKLSVKVHDVRRKDETVRLMRNYDVGVGALPHAFSEYTILSTIRAGVDFVDLIFGWRFGRTGIDSAAKKKGITIIPACGLAPGLSNILVMAGAEQLDVVEEVHIKVGGIPEKPKPPLNYRIVFSFEAVLEEYLRDARIIKHGRIIDVPALSGVEALSFPHPIGRCECFYTDGLSTLIQTMRNVREMDEKTIRWPGHVDQLRTLIECGLLDTAPVEFNETSIVPRKFVSRLLSDKLMLGNDRDLTLLRIDVMGNKEKRQVHRRYEMIDHYDAKHRTTSMARTTAFPCSIAAQLLGSGRVATKGVCPPELAFKNELRNDFLGYLKQRGLRITSGTI